MLRANVGHDRCHRFDTEKESRRAGTSRIGAPNRNHIEKRRRDRIAPLYHAGRVNRSRTMPARFCLVASRYIGRLFRNHRATLCATNFANRILSYCRCRRTGILLKNSIRQFYRPTVHTSNWVTTEKMATKKQRILGESGFSGYTMARGDRQFSQGLEL